MASAWKGTKTSFPGALSECLDAAKSYCADSHSPALEILQPHKLGALLGAIKTDISSHGAYGWTHTFNTFPNLFELLSTLSKSRFVTLTPSTLSVLIECISSVIQELPADSTLDAEKTDGLRFMQQSANEWAHDCLTHLIYPDWAFTKSTRRMQLMQHIVGNQAFETCVRDVWIEAATAAADATTIAAALSSPTAQQSESERMKQLVSMQHIICTLCPFLRENRTAVAGNMLPSALVQAVADTIDNRVPRGVFTFSSPMLARVELKKAVSFVDVSPGTLTGAKTGRHAQNIPMPLVAPRSADSHAATSSALATCEAFEAFVAENGKPASSFFGPEACVERVLDLVRSVAASDAFVSKDRIRYLLCQAVPYSSSRRSDSSFASLLRMIISMLEGLVHATKHLHVVRVLQVAVAVHFDLLIASANTFSDAAALHKEVMRIFPLSQSAYFVPFSQSFPHLSSSALVITAENIANQRRIGIVDGKETYWLSSLKLPCSIMPCLYGTPNARDYAIDVIDELLTSPGASDRSHLFRSVVSVVTANCPANIGPAVMQCLTSCALLPLNWRTVTWSLALLIGLLPNDDEAVREYVEVIFFNSKDCGAYARGLRCDEVTRGEKRNVDLLAGLFSSVVEDVAAAAFNIVLDAASAQHAPATSEAVTRTYRNVLQKFMKAAAVFAGHISPSTHAQHADALDKSSLSLKAAAEYLEKVSN